MNITLNLYSVLVLLVILELVGAINIGWKVILFILGALLLVELIILIIIGVLFFVFIK